MQTNKNQLALEILALDLESCDRCVGTGKNLEEAVSILQPVLDSMDVTIQIKSTIVASLDQAISREFTISPTIRLNGRDIALDAKEDQCDSCSDLCGCPEGTTCRIWTYRGKEYTTAPTAFLIESILRDVLSESTDSGNDVPVLTEVPDNLVRFFNRNPDRACCTPEEKENCCAPEDKEACCGDDSQKEQCFC